MRNFKFYLILILIFKINCIDIKSQNISEIGAKAIVSNSLITWKSTAPNYTIPFEAENSIGVQLYCNLFENNYFELVPSIGYYKISGSSNWQQTYENGQPGEMIKLNDEIKYVSTQIHAKGFYSISDKIKTYLALGVKYDVQIESSDMFESLEKDNLLNKKLLSLSYQVGANYHLDNFVIALEFASTIKSNVLAEYNFEYFNDINSTKVSSSVYSINLCIGYKLK